MDGTDNCADDDSSSGDDHQIIVFLGDYASCCDRPSLRCHFRRDDTGSTATLARILINRRSFAIAVLIDYQQLTILWSKIERYDFISFCQANTAHATTGA